MKRPTKKSSKKIPKKTPAMSGKRVKRSAKTGAAAKRKATGRTSGTVFTDSLVAAGTGACYWTDGNGGRFCQVLTKALCDSKQGEWYPGQACPAPV